MVNKQTDLDPVEWCHLVMCVGRNGWKKMAESTKKKLNLLKVTIIFFLLYCNLVGRYKIKFI